MMQARHTSLDSTCTNSGRENHARICEKAMNARTHIFWHFLHHVGLWHNVDTHVAHKINSEAEAVAHEFMDLTRDKAATMNPNNAWNWTRCPCHICTTIITCGWWRDKRWYTWKHWQQIQKGWCSQPRWSWTTRYCFHFTFLRTKMVKLRKMNFQCSLPYAFMLSEKALMDESMMDLWIEQCLFTWKNAPFQHHTPAHVGLILCSYDGAYGHKSPITRNQSSTHSRWLHLLLPTNRYRHSQVN